MNPAQQPNNFYLLSPSNFVFECTPFDVSGSLLTEPAFINYADFSSLGFNNVSQIATLDICANMINNMFLFQPNVSEPFNVLNVNSSVMQYGIVNTSYNFSFSQSTAAGRRLPNDYIKAINYEIARTDTIIFKNITQITNDIENLDSIFNLKIKQNISTNIRLNGSLHSETQSLYAYACKQLIAGILTYSTDDRKKQFFDDLETQTPPYSVVFHPGDSIVMRIGYVPKNGNGAILDGLVNPMNNKLYTRTYKVLLNVE